MTAARAVRQGRVGGGSLLEDANLSRDDVPTETRLVPERHSDEVRLAVFSRPPHPAHELGPSH